MSCFIPQRDPVHDWNCSTLLMATSKFEFLNWAQWKYDKNSNGSNEEEFWNACSKSAIACLHTLEFHTKQNFHAKKLAKRTKVPRINWIRKRTPWIKSECWMRWEKKGKKWNYYIFVCFPRLVANLLQKRVSVNGCLGVKSSLQITTVLGDDKIVSEDVTCP